MAADTRPSDRDYERLLKYFLLKVKQGIILNYRDLKNYCVRNGIEISKKRLREIRYEFKYTAMHSQARVPLGYMSNSMPKYGTYFVDYAHVYDSFARYNEGFKGMLVFTEGISNKTFAVPLKSKNTEAWTNGIVKFLREHDDEVRTFVSDRDSVITKSFRDWVKTEFNISWIFLYNRSKSFRAESMISYLKNRLAVALKTSDTKRWIDILPLIIRDYNSRYIKGTKIKRGSVNKDNYMDFLARKYKTDRPGLMLNLLTANKFLKSFEDKLFKFQIGQTVLVRSDSNYSSQKKTFKKKSLEGSFDSEIFVVVRKLLKASGRLFVTPVYKIQGKKSGLLKSLFYETDLVPAKFASRVNIVSRRRG